LPSGRDLEINHVHQGIQNKAGVFRQLLEKEGITAAEVASSATMSLTSR